MGLSLEPDHSPSRIDFSVVPDATTPIAGVGTGLRRMFDDVVTSPMPQTLLDLCDALEEAFQRGRLSTGCDRKKSA